MTIGRHRQGRGDDRAAHGDDVLLPRHRRDGGARLAAARAAPRRSSARSTASRWTATSRPATRWPCSPTGWPRTRRSSAGARGCASSRARARGDHRAPRPHARRGRRGRDRSWWRSRCAGPAPGGRRCWPPARVANSPLVKTAINGADPNWGRIMMALGKSARPGWPRTRWPSRFGDELLVEKGMLEGGRPLDRIREIMGGARATPIAIDLGLGRGEDRCGHPTSARSTFESTGSTRPSTHDYELRSRAAASAPGEVSPLPGAGRSRAEANRTTGGRRWHH